MTLDDFMPYAGTCIFCGHYDKRHRLIDCARGRLRAGDSKAEVMRDYGWTRTQLEVVLKVRLQRKARA